MSNGFYIATEVDLREELARLQSNTSSPAQRSFGEALATLENVGASKRAELNSESGRILRASLFDAFAAVVRAIENAEFPKTCDLQVHMCYVSRSGIQSCEGTRLTPSKRRDWDGFDRLTIQKTSYVDTWTPIDAQGIAEVLAGRGVVDKCVRSLRCFWESFFDHRGSFVAQFSLAARDHLVIVRTDNYEPDVLKIGETWHAQTDIDNAIRAFTQVALLRFEKECSDPLNRTLFWLSVGSNSLGWGDERRRLDRAAKLSTVDFVQSVWIVVSLPTVALNGNRAVLRRFAAAIPEIDSVMTQSLVLESARKQAHLMVELEADKRQLKALKSQIDAARSAYEDFDNQVRKVFKEAQAPTTLLREFANELWRTMFADGAGSYKSEHHLEGAALLPSIHLPTKSNFTAAHGMDLLAKLDRHLSKKARERFCQVLLHDGEKLDLAHAVWIKDYVYEAFSDSKNRSLLDFKVGSLRAALLWRCTYLKDTVQDDSLLFAPQHGLIEDGRAFLTTIVNLIHAWLGVGDEEAQRIQVFKSSDGTFRLTGGVSSKHLDIDRFKRLQEELDECSLSHRPLTGGDLSSSLWALTRASPRSPPIVSFGVQDNHGATSVAIVVTWPTYGVAEARLATVQVGCDIGVTGGGEEKYLKFRFPQSLT